MTALAAATDAGKPANVKASVLDSACAITKSLKKPISPECATACAKAGSPLVILGDNGTIYWPIADTTPWSGQNEKLLPFAGRKVRASGKIFQRGDSSALVKEKIELLSGQNWTSHCGQKVLTSFVWTRRCNARDHAERLEIPVQPLHPWDYRRTG